MKFFGLIAVGALAGLLSVGAADAQIREQQPAEFPPASYKGKQYVDSSGCVFIRAGIDGDVSWVPRVSRARKIVCGFQPSLAAQTASVAPAPAPTPKEKPVQIVVEAAPATAVTPSPRPAPKRVVAPRPAAPVVVRQTAPKPAPVAKPRIVAKPVVIAATPEVRVPQPGGTACPGASAISQKYLQTTPGLPVRCGPQGGAIVAGKSAAQVKAAPNKTVVIHDPVPRAVYAQTVTATTRIAPKHVVQNRVNTQNTKVPHGYTEVWTDDRLNPKRAEQNLQGRSDMLLIWTQTVPHRLIEQHTGKDVTASVPLIYPYTSVTEQRRGLGEVTIVQRDGQTLKRIVRLKKSGQAVRQPVYSSRSTPVEPKVKKVSKAPAVQGKKYVQIGTYRNAANAQKAAQQIARMGMPARIGKHRKGGTSYMTVQVGPFDGSDRVRNVLRQMRDIGYTDAFARN